MVPFSCAAFWFDISAEMLLRLVETRRRQPGATLDMSSDGARSFSDERRIIAAYDKAQLSSS
jgi:hypothetical protein